MGLLARAVTELHVERLGLVPYSEAWALQTELHGRRARREIPDTLLLLEHPHVYTIGRRGAADDVLWDDETLRARGVEVVETDRGGQVTYHGPGQLVGYPIIDLGPGADLVAYVRRLEDVLMATLTRFGIAGTRDPGNTGVWVGAAKIAAIGVRVTRSVTKHGFALNVSPDLSYFAGIVPCGIFDKGVTSIQAELGEAPPIDAVADVVAEVFR
ncbi:MAG TPA: lipoyl(octanoyl) transferase LipB [Actinomycetota bacterium]|nr:lipoyl(octanoyl) transferase LipB [Actinomycetota bacterium]